LISNITLSGSLKTTFIVLVIPIRTCLSDVLRETCWLKTNKWQSVNCQNNCRCRNTCHSSHNRGYQYSLHWENFRTLGGMGDFPNIIFCAHLGRFELNVHQSGWFLLQFRSIQAEFVQIVSTWGDFLGQFEFQILFWEAPILQYNEYHVLDSWLCVFTLIMNSLKRHELKGEAIDHMLVVPLWLDREL